MLHTKDGIKRFEHESVFTDRINAQYELIHLQIDRLADEMCRQMKKDKQDYMQSFESNLRVLHKDYRALESQHQELTSQQKLEQDIEVKLRHKEKLRLECEEIDTRHKKALEENARFKTLD